MGIGPSGKARAVELFCVGSSGMALILELYSENIKNTSGL